MFAIYKRELRKYFLSPVGYIFIGFFLLVAGIFFSLEILFPQSPSFLGVFSSLLFVFLLLLPILTMRLMSEDRNKKVDQLLLTSPLKLIDIVLGKYLAAVTVFLLSLIVIGIYPVIMDSHGHVNMLGTYVGFLGFFLLGCAFISVGLFISSTTESQVIAAVVTFGVLFALWMVDYIAVVLPSDIASGIVFCVFIVVGIGFLVYRTTKNIFATIVTSVLLFMSLSLMIAINIEMFAGIMYKLLSQLSLLKRLNGFMIGAISIGPIVYYISFSGVFVYLTIRTLEKRRWS